MNDDEHILNDDEFFADTVGTPREGIEQHRKRECLKCAINSGKGHLLGRKWTEDKVDKASDDIVNKTYAKYKQREITGKGEKNGKAVDIYVISLYSTGISRVVKIRDVKKLHQDTEDDPIIKDQMANLGCLLVCTFGNLMAPVLVAAHTVGNLDLSVGESHDHLTAQYEQNESGAHGKI